MRQENDEKGKQKRTLRNVKWLAHYLGVSRNTVHEWVMDDHIPYINLGVKGGRRIIRFDPEVIDSWLLERSHAPGGDKSATGKDKEQEIE